MKWRQITTTVLISCLVISLIGCKNNNEELPESDITISETTKSETTESDTTRSDTSRSDTPTQMIQAKPTYPYYEFIDSRVWGYLDQDGKPIVMPKFQSAEWFDKNGLAIVSVSSNDVQSQFGLIDPKGQFVVEPNYSSIKAYQVDNYIAHKNYQTSAIFDSQGRLIKTLEGFIGDFSEGKASIWNGQTYGYVNLEGNYIIEPKFKSAAPFRNGKALVSTIEGKYALINDKGQFLHNYYVQSMKGFSEGLAAVKPVGNKNFGYMNENGEIIIDAKYETANDFHEGLAVVWSQAFSNTAGLINTDGEYVLPGQYGNIRYIGNSLWAVSKEFRDNYSLPSEAYRFALVNKEGKMVTDFEFDAIESFIGDYAVAEQGLTTFFIDRSGKKVESLPTINGNGSVKRQDDVISAYVDGKLTYLTSKGEIIWSASREHDLGNGIKLNEEKYRPDRDTLVYYPQIAGLKDSSIKDQLNTYLKQEALKYIPLQAEKSDFFYRQSIGASYSVTWVKQSLLVLEYSSYVYSGGAHGMPAMYHLHIDLQSGHIYELKDLFKKDSLYIQEISRILNDQMQLNGLELGMFEHSIESFETIRAEQPFYILNDVLNIYFPPYEMGSYAAGFITLQIPLPDLDEIIDQEGAFWKAIDNSET
jgi:hypothetical protein